MTPIDVDDLYQHRTIGSLHGHRHDDRVVFTLERPDRKKDAYRTALWVADGGGARKIVSASRKPASPRLAPDGGQVAFVAASGKTKHALRLLRLGEIDSRRVGKASTTLQSIEDWSPAAARLLVLHKVPWQEDALDDTEAGSSRPQVARHLPYKRDGSGFIVGHRIECRVFDLDTAQETRLLSGDFDVQQARWSPDGGRIAYIRTRDGTQRQYTDVWIVDADGRDARQLTGEFAAVNALAWSPDGSRLALSAGALSGDSISELFVVDVADGRCRRATAAELQLETGDPLWHADGRRVAVIAARRGLQQIVVVDADDGSLQPFEQGLSHVTSLCCAGADLAFVAATMRICGELRRIGWSGEDAARVTRFNRWLRERRRPRVRKRRFDADDGDGRRNRIDAWLLTPADREPPYPVLMDMHGGPQSAALIDFAGHVYWYALLARGWMIVAPNAVGSGGYGFDFARRLRGCWGRLDLPQHEAVLAQLQREGLAGDVAVCTGTSYGGYLSAWALGHSDRFARTIIRSPVANLESHTGTSDSGYYVSPYAVCAELDENRARYRALSPIEECSTRDVPTLLLQGEDDQRCPLGQSEEIFTHLVRCGRPAVLVVYPGATHALAASGKPSQRVDYHRRIMHWAVGALGEDARP